MNTFVSAIQNKEARTENGMKARESSASSNCDLFYRIGASRRKDLTAEFSAALAEDEDLALRILQWARDVRGGAGERQTFRNLLLLLSSLNPSLCKKVMVKVPEIGRWDDLLIFQPDSAMEKYAFSLIERGLKGGNGLCAKWMPRKGHHFNALQKHLSLSPKQMRKLLVSLTNVVETQMCKNQWEEINYEHVPSVASANYRKAFGRHDPEGFASFLESVKKGEKKINASSIFPHDVVKSLIAEYHWPSSTELEQIRLQWEALPNPFEGKSDCPILPIVDVSGSMMTPAGKSNVTCLQIAISLGLFCADKNKGKFAGTFLPFSGNAKLHYLKGDIVQKIQQIQTSKWEMNTNLHAAFKEILNVAKSGNVPDSEMPKAVLILSDMQFDSCVQFDDSAFQMIKRKYEESGYSLPSVVFWNLNDAKNVPVKFDQRGTALISGFSPSILSSVLSGDLSNLSPESIMMKAVMKDRYSLS